MPLVGRELAMVRGHGSRELPGERLTCAEPPKRVVDQRHPHISVMPGVVEGLHVEAQRRQSVPSPVHLPLEGWRRLPEVVHRDHEQHRPECLGGVRVRRVATAATSSMWRASGWAGHDVVGWAFPHSIHSGASPAAANQSA